MESKLRQRLFSQKCFWGREKGLKWGPAAIFYLLERERERERCQECRKLKMKTKTQVSFWYTRLSDSRPTYERCTSLEEMRERKSKKERKR